MDKIKFLEKLLEKLQNRYFEDNNMDVNIDYTEYTEYDWNAYCSIFNNLKNEYFSISLCCAIPNEIEIRYKNEEVGIEVSSELFNNYRNWFKEESYNHKMNMIDNIINNFSIK